MPNKEILQKYATLLVNYCLEVKHSDKVFITSTYLAEPLLREVVKEVYLAGGHPVLNVDIDISDANVLKLGEKHQLEWINPMKRIAFETFDCYLNIRAPFLKQTDKREEIDTNKYQIFQNAQQELNRLYFERTGNGSMRRSLCQYPTQDSADDAELSLEEYKKFVFQACNLYEENPMAKWLEVRQKQAAYVERLNQADKVHYKGPNIDIQFSVKGRKWMNSDGRANMPSGEVFSAPIEDSVNGKVHFTYPTVYMGKDVEGVTLEVKNGQVVSWKAEKGQEVLDKVLSIPGANYFGEVAVGTNYNIQRTTRNILFDEKIGGSIHMAVGQSYKQCGGKNESTIHWDMITDMKNGGEIYADGELIYQNGRFII